MNARLTSIGFYITCIIFFGFQSKPLIHANNTITPVTTAQHDPIAQNKVSNGSVEIITGIKKEKQTQQPVTSTQGCR